jgi:Mg2+ and Co2+ transporter CorA
MRRKLLARILVDYALVMPHVWMMVKNGQKGGHRSPAAFRADAKSALDEFERSLPDGSVLHSSVREYVGIAEGDRVVDVGSLVSSPYPFLQSHGDYLIGLLATPTNVSDGLTEFTSLVVLASPSGLATFVIDPPETYAGPFGQRLLNRANRHEASGSDDVGATLLMIVRDNVTSLNFALRELELDINHYSRGLLEFDTSRRRDGSDLLRMIETYMVKLRTEIDSLSTVVGGTLRLVEDISEHRLSMDGDADVFHEDHEISARALAMQVRSTLALQERLAQQIVHLLGKCERLHEKFFAEATHTIGAITAMLLLPSLVLGFYGQSVRFSGIGPFSVVQISLLLMFVSSVAAFVYARRRQWF